MIALQFAIPILLVAFCGIPLVGWLFIREPEDYWLCWLAGLLVVGGAVGVCTTMWFIGTGLWSLAGIIVEQGWI